MKIKIQQYLAGTLLSWAICGQQIGRSLLKMGYNVDLISTDGIDPKYIPADLKPYVKEKSEGSWDLSIAYTMMKNFPFYLAGGAKKVGIYNIDSTILNPEMIKYHNFCDYLCPSSNFSAEVFRKSGVPAEKIHVIPHGINLKDFENKEKYLLKTKKSFKFFWNVATPHLRKNIKDTLKIWGKAFNKTDDVCLVIRANREVKKSPSYVDFPEVIKRFKSEFPQHAEIEVIYDYVSDMVTLYNACNVVIMLSNIEMWSLPCLEAISSNKILIASNYGGQLHYLNDNNSLLVGGNVVRMPSNYAYWNSKNGEMFSPLIDEAVEKMRYAFENHLNLIEKFGPENKKTSEEFTWDNATKKLLDLVQ